jgi:two-component system, response regulator YesN
MYKLMVVDDEQLAIESVKYIVENDIKNITLTETARSGREAIEKVRTDRPDIILMDIHMPGINGLEAIKEINKIHNNIKFIIVSAYEYFEFAQQAVELGVKDYLTKPLNKIRLIETLEHITIQLGEEIEKHGQELETREKIEKMLNIVEHSFIYSLLLSEGQKVDIGRYKELFEIESKNGYIFIVTFKNKSGKPPKEILLGDGVQNQMFYSYFKDNLKYKAKCIVGPAILDRVVVYVSESIEDDYTQRVQSIDLIEKMIEKLEDKFDTEFSVGIGKVRSDDDIMISYQEALKALKFDEGGKVTHIDDVLLNLNNIGYEILADEQKIISGIQKGDTGLCVGLLNDIFIRYPNFFEVESIRNRLFEIMVVAHRIAIENGIDGDDYIGYSQYISQIIGCKTKEKFERMCVEKIGYITSKIKQTKKTTIGIIVDNANEIIAKRFSHELTLDDISKELCISPQYFSRLYKDEMGINFIEQLTNERIKNAKTLMKKGGYSIKEICYMSGYSDPHYFSRLFKKHEGVSPSVYLKQI